LCRNDESSQLQILVLHEDKNGEEGCDKWLKFDSKELEEDGEAEEEAVD
jgi:hypothetical protein